MVLLEEQEENTNAVQENTNAVQENTNAVQENANAVQENDIQYGSFESLFKTIKHLITVLNNENHCR